jgi:predicted TIM-barrel fold metal-dependent hydrolase
VADWSEVTYLKESLDQGGISREVYDKITWKNASRVLELGVEGEGRGHG